MSVWRLGWRVSQHEPRSFWSGYLLFVLFFTFPVLSGWLLGPRLRRARRPVTTRASTGSVPRSALCEVARMSTIHLGALMWTRAWVHMQSLLRANLLTAQVASGGPEAGQPVGSAGEAITHFRDDVEDVTHVHRRLRRHLGRRRLHRARRTGARQRRWTRGSGAADPAGRGRHGDAHARRPHQALPRRRPSCGIGGQRPARRRDGRRDDGEGQQRDRADDRASPQVGRRTPSHGGARSRAGRERVGLQPRRCRCRARSGLADRCRRHGLGTVQRRRARHVLRVPRLVELPATDGRAACWPAASR